MERTALLHADYLDILFDRRNKAYGGYELRKHYPQRVKKAVLGVLIATGVICAYTVFGNTAEHTKIAFRDHGPTILTPPPEFETPRPKVMPPEAPPPPVASKIFVPPVIKPDNEIKPDETLVAQKDLKGNMISDANHDGPATGTDISVPTGEHPTGGGGEIVESATAAPPITWVEQMPQFNGNMNDYLMNNIHYPEQAKEAGIEGRVAIQFVVDENGDISDARIVKGIGGGCDQEALRVVKSMPRWKPGKNNGRAVKVLLTLPVTFTLEH